MVESPPPIMQALYAVLDSGEDLIYGKMRDGVPASMLLYYHHKKTNLIFSVDTTLSNLYPPGIVSPMEYKFSEEEMKKISNIMQQRQANAIMDKLIT